MRKNKSKKNLEKYHLDKKDQNKHKGGTLDPAYIKYRQSADERKDKTCSCGKNCECSEQGDTLDPAYI